MRHLFSLIFVLSLVFYGVTDALRAQVAGRDTLALSGGELDTTLETTPKNSDRLWRRPLIRHEATTSIISREAYRFYASPITFSQLMEESGLAYPLILSDEGYGRESLLLTNRTSEPLISSRANRALPLNDPLTGNSMLNLFSMDAFQTFALDEGARGLFQSGADPAASDQIDLTIERFRSPLPFSRIHYTQVLSTEFSNFDGVFSVNPDEASNVMLGVWRRARPRVDLWSSRAQFTYEHWRDRATGDTSTGKPAVVIKEKTFDLLLWTNYLSTFNGLSGGIASPTDSENVFDEQLAQEIFPRTHEHRVRVDGLAQMELPFLGSELTRVSLYGTYSGRRLSETDSATPLYASSFVRASRFGASLEQPFALRIGSFLTRATVLGEVQLLDKEPTILPAETVNDTRLMAGISDSISLAGMLGIDLYGAAKIVQSNVKLGFNDVESRVFPTIGLTGSVDIADWVQFTASYNYAKDWAVHSPSPTTEYQLRNISGFFDARIALSRSDSLALHIGILDRNEPEGLIYNIPNDGVLIPTFSNQNIHSQSALLKLDAYFSYFRWSSSLTYYPGTVPISRFTTHEQANVPLKLRFFGWSGIFYENEIAEGNLRISFGARVRYLNRLAPTLTYDPFADYYVYTGLRVDSVGNVLDDPRLSQPKGMFDILLSTEVDRRAQVNMTFLNVLSAPFYNTDIYPRRGFQWRIDVTWAFLD